MNPVEHLEANLAQATKTFRRESMDYEEGDGLDRIIALGAYQEGGPDCGRPMFQVMSPRVSIHRATRVIEPCPACYDFSRSWNCHLHADNLTPWEV